MNATETTTSDRTSIDTTDHIRAQWQARSIAPEATEATVATVARARRIRTRRILLVLASTLGALGPAVLATMIGVRAGEAFRVLLLTVVPVALAYLLLRPR